jgi:hypothetical protein
MEARRRTFMKRTATAAALWLLPVSLCAQWVNLPTPGIPRTANGKPNLTAPAPRAANGKPDFTGLWVMPLDTAVGNILVRNVGDLKPADIQPWAQALLRQRAENFSRDNPRYRCLPQGPGYSTGAGGGGMMRFIQTPTMIAILHEDLTYRQIFMDGRTLESDPNPSWMGYSVGHWDGDTLVIESSGFNDRTWLIDGYPHTEQLRMTERYRRTDFGHLAITVTFQDPGAYAKAWTVPVTAQFVADTEMLEDVCNENDNSGQEHWVGKLSDEQKSAVKVAPEILAKYVGVYTGQYIQGSRTVEVSFDGGALFISLNGGPKQPIFPQSETSFSGTGLKYQFIRDERGIATDVVEDHVSGGYKYERQK